MERRPTSIHSASFTFLPIQTARCYSDVFHWRGLPAPAQPSPRSMIGRCGPPGSRDSGDGLGEERREGISEIGSQRSSKAVLNDRPALSRENLRPVPGRAKTPANGANGRCARAGGEMLAGMELDKGGRPGENLSHGVTGLSDLGISRTQSSRRQRMTRVPHRRNSSSFLTASSSSRRSVSALFIRSAISVRTSRIVWAISRQVASVSLCIPTLRHE